MNRRLVYVLIVILALCLLACGTVGHAGLQHDRRSYSDVELDPALVMTLEVQP